MDRSSLPPWTRVCNVSDIPRLGSRVLKHADGDIALFRTADDEVFALLDRCPHKGGALSQGIVHGKAVTCPLHAWNIELDSGAARAPDEGCARRFPVKVDGDAVFVCLA
ncbi:nitrite reductase small subunit NirD [Trinickia fusca]|uniref:Nitrite reductase (NAD(P)H) small subunit n=1 Tax=Trinickia fusca TaxID=2419777 RepID=A0A494X8C2_9BURK|nr:nitrite reductase small subunit NirD [Trinickia fusca]RKP44606.1 nitrite reductase (NAD(P)H) small subunit [Trinickia fusca]